jgi:phosphoglycerol transferase MdoB-like AlkP superfamily enzyme
MEFISRLGALTQDLRITSFPGIYWRPLVLMRWTATMLIMTLLRHKFYLQIFLLIGISTVFQAMILGSKPMLANLGNYMLLFNEIMVSLYLYHLLCLTDFMGDHDNRDSIAWSLLFIVVFTVLVNLVKFLLVCDWCFLINKIKMKFNKIKKYEDNNKIIDESNDLNEITGLSEKDEKNQLNIKKKNEIASL